MIRASYHAALLLGQLLQIDSKCVGLLVKKLAVGFSKG